MEDANKPAGNGPDKTGDQMNDTDLTADQIAAIADAEEARGHLSTTINQKVHWRTKAQEAQKALDDYKAAHPEAPAPEVRTQKKDGKEPDLSTIKAELKEELSLETKYPELDATDMKRAKAVAEADGKSLRETIESPFFQAILTQRRAEMATDNAAAVTSNRTGQAGAQDWNRFVKDPTLLRSLPPAERKKFTTWLETQKR